MSLVFLALAWFSGMLLADQVLVPRILLGIAGLWACTVAVLERRHPSLSKCCRPGTDRPTWLLAMAGGAASRSSR